MKKEEALFILESIVMIAEYGWKLLPKVVCETCNLCITLLFQTHWLRRFLILVHFLGFFFLPQEQTNFVFANRNLLAVLDFVYRQLEY